MTQPNQILGPREQASRDADEAFEKHARGKLSLPKPIRIQRKRTKGYDMQAESRAINGLECVYVGRPTVYGNPCISAEAFQEYIYSGLENRICRGGSMNVAFDAMSGYKRRKKLIEELPKLRGKNLACFCPIDQPCHADVLLELANR